ncbi:MAG: prephenate dehydratase [Flavobacterium sp.]|jgi:prephenate dehydratase|uniref:prephenate dehydratase n=1 Tax=Flavobacterium TaxID=237 RepID=UPI000DB625F0|nr:prephenate dehydratase [Flavobacterium sp.]MCZ8090005.1 prephenate dehydratase [Flavobacterium sp.]MCZ8330575.1 prephenate dehydratase [Flavobacterium sp.]PZO29952.1 MAG: prephenate dehydratase [Flavobacteriaceae bacterium]
METKIAIQGIKGSFHHQVAQEYFEQKYDLDECMSFEELVKSLTENKTQKAVMALENSIAGSIIPNYALIDRNNLHIIGEHYLNIHMNLMVLKSQTIEDIKEVHSHPIALLQCAVFFSQFPHIKLVESGDTAETARRIQEQKLTGIGAVAAPIAAELYDLEILASGIHTVQSNKTRFVIVKTTNKELPKEEINKASIKFELDDTPGSLATVLNVMNNCKLNLTKIQSMPIIEQPFKYSFFVDVIFEKYKHYEKAKNILALMTTHFKVLGEYKRGKQ